MVGSPVGFPSGAHRTETKVQEARLLVEDGVQEMDMMVNVGKLKSGDYEYVKTDLRHVIDAVHPLPVKVILEVAYLDSSEIRRACELSVECGADFVKTSTGWADGGVTSAVVELIKKSVGDAIKIKASGGIRSLDTLISMYKRGVSRFGINLDASVAILNEVRRLPGGEVELGD